MHVHAPTRVVLLLGGPYDLESKTPVHSFRDALIRVQHRAPLSKIEFRLAEEANITHPSNPYTNWQSFEIDIAQLFQLVLLFCESEGSIAELSAFATIDEIAQRMLVVVDNVNYGADSYIHYGIFEHLIEKYGRSKIFVLHYEGLNVAHLESKKGIDLDEFFRRMRSEIPKHFDNKNDPRSFDATREGHIIKFITGMIQHFGALKLDEIEFILYIFKISQDKIRIKQFL